MKTFLAAICLLVSIVCAQAQFTAAQAAMLAQQAPAASGGSITSGLLWSAKLDENTGTSLAASAGTSSGTFNGTWTNGIINKGIALLGSSTQSADFGANSDTQPSGSTGTVAVWVYETFHSSTTIIGNLNFSSDRNGFGILEASSNIRFELCSAGAANITGAVGGMSLEAWHLLCATWDGSTITVYIDNAILTTMSQTVNPSYANHLFLGTDTSHVGYFYGSMDTPYIWSRALTGAEVTNTLWNGGAGLQLP